MTTSVRGAECGVRSAEVFHPASRIPHPARACGFTLVELLVAATMMSVLFVGLGTHLRAGLTVWQRATTTGERIQRQRVGLERLERDLANAFIYDIRDASYGQTQGTLIRPQLDSETLAYFTVSAQRAATPPSVRFVTYRCGEYLGVAGLWRTSQSIGDMRARREAVPEQLLPECERLSVRYAAPSADAAEPMTWREQWSQAEKSLPRLVEVTVHAPAGRTLTRLFAIPIGGGKQ